MAQAIKGRICQETNLKNVEELKKHCKDHGDAPTGNPFLQSLATSSAHLDSLKQHQNLPPTDYLKVTPEKSAEKRRVTEEKHRVFIQWLEHRLMTDEDIGRSFSQIIKERYPESSKKRTGGRK